MRHENNGVWWFAGGNCRAKGCEAATMKWSTTASEIREMICRTIEADNDLLDVKVLVMTEGSWNEISSR
jgi:hypothetical protein